MSASREKKIRQEQTASGYVDPKAAKEAEARKAEKRSNVLYAAIAAVFVLAVVASVIWKSNVIPRNTKAVTIDGQSYTASETSFFYQNVYRTFLNNYSYYLSYAGLDTSAPLADQTVNETAASLFGIEEGTNWRDYFLDRAVEQMTSVQNGLKKASEEGFVFPESVQTQYNEAMDSLKDVSKSSGLSVSAYLKNVWGELMTKSVYEKQLMRLLQYYSYSNAYTESLTYEDDALEAAYADDKQSYDRVFWEYVVVDGQAESTEDAEGNTVEPTEEEQDAALEQAHHTAEEILAGYASGASLSELAAAYENATYSMSTTTTYYGDAVSEWLFDEARTNGDTDIIADGTTFCVALFHSRGRDESPTIDVRHILITPESGKLTSEDEGYAAEQEALKAAAKEEAEAILEEWKAGEATEDSFAALAMERSADSNAASGGLYEAVYPGQMVAEFNDWCFDPARQSGDTAVVETSYGAHVMYFVGPNAERWKTQVSATLRNKDVAAWAEELIADADVVRNDAGLSRIG